MSGICENAHWSHYYVVIDKFEALSALQIKMLSQIIQGLYHIFYYSTFNVKNVLPDWVSSFFVESRSTSLRTSVSKV